MAEWSNATSLLELAFGVNAVAVALLPKLQVSNAEIARRLSERISQIEPTLSLSEEEQDSLPGFLMASSWGLRLLKWIGRILSLTGLAISGLAIYGLLEAAINPTGTVPDIWVLRFVGFTLVVMPVIYFGYERGLEWFVRAMVREINDESLRLTVTAHRVVRRAQKFMDTTDEVLHDVHAQLFSMRFKDFWFSVTYHSGMAVFWVKQFVARLWWTVKRVVHRDENDRNADSKGQRD